jgi:hypothetical protein
MNEDALVKKLRGLTRAEITPETEEWLKRTALATDSKRVRNAAALAVAKHKIHSLAESLIDLLVSKETLRARGTLVYALYKLNKEVPIELLVRLIEEDSFETRNHVLDILQDVPLHLSSSEYEGAISALREVTKSRDPEGAAAAADAIKILRARYAHEGRVTLPAKAP